VNERLRPKFLDLKEGAVLLSLTPFSAPGARLTARNADDMRAIFDVRERRYRSGAVSWGAGGGAYYVHTVDRAGYAADYARWETGVDKGRSRSGKGRKYMPSHYDD
jgi:H3 lysine-79-specific histone-lysine N-methyltransferase